MKSKKVFLVILLAFVLLIGGASLLYNKLQGEYKSEQLGQNDTEKSEEGESETEENEENENNVAPNFTVYDAEGNQVKLSDYIGKPIVLNFWASWCGPCKSEMPGFHEKYLELKDEVVFLMVNMTDGQRETLEIAMDYVEEQQYAFKVLYDTDSDAANTYQVYSLPTTYFLDREGNLIARANGAIDGETLQRGIDMVK